MKGGEKMEGGDVRESEGKEKKEKRKGEWGSCCTFWEEGGDKVILSHPTMS
jgi:hypothetical protein